VDVLTVIGSTAVLIKSRGLQHVFKTIIAKTFHEALDVMFATARYRIGCKGFVTYKGKI
jgi:hypothetical protein